MQRRWLSQTAGLWPACLPPASGPLAAYLMGGLAGTMSCRMNMKGAAQYLQAPGEGQAQRDHSQGGRMAGAAPEPWHACF